MMARHTRYVPSHKVVLDAFVAKRRSEMTPTVGGVTDLFFIGVNGFSGFVNLEQPERRGDGE